MAVVEKSEPVFSASYFSNFRRLGARRGCRNSLHAFTLIELLVVIAILAILMALAFPLAGRARESARSAKCMGNIRTVGAAMTSYMVENGRYPRSADATTGFTGRFWWFTEIGRYFTDGAIFTVDGTGWVLMPEPNYMGSDRAFPLPRAIDGSSISFHSYPIDTEPLIQRIMCHDLSVHLDVSAIFKTDGRPGSKRRRFVPPLML